MSSSLEQVYEDSIQRYQALVDSADAQYRAEPDPQLSHIYRVTAKRYRKKVLCTQKRLLDWKEDSRIREITKSRLRPQQYPTDRQLTVDVLQALDRLCDPPSREYNPSGWEDSSLRPQQYPTDHQCPADLQQILDRLERRAKLGTVLSKGSLVLFLVTLCCLLILEQVCSSYKPKPSDLSVTSNFCRYWR